MLDSIIAAAEKVAARNYPNDPFRREAVKEKLVREYLKKVKQ